MLLSLGAYNLTDTTFRLYVLVTADRGRSPRIHTRDLNRYHESTSSFSALATQSSQLTRSESALYDKDNPSFTGQLIGGLTFQKLPPEKLREYRQKLGLREWTDEPNES